MTGRNPSQSPALHPVGFQLLFQPIASHGNKPGGKMNILTMHRSRAPPLPMAAGIHMLIAPRLPNCIVTVCL
jgi:hypothetical protein